LGHHILWAFDLGVNSLPRCPLAGSPTQSCFLIVWDQFAGCPDHLAIRDWGRCGGWPGQRQI